MTSVEQKRADFAMQRRSDRRFGIIMISILMAVLAGFVFLVFEGVTVAIRHHDRFMSQCMQDHKEYECTAMWRAGDSAVPAVIVIPTGRL